MKILIAEDNADDRKLLRYNLEHHGCEVIEASDGAEGLRLAKVGKPDMIVSDALMPVMDGFQFLRSIKMDETLRSIPFIFYSAVYIGYKEAELAISLGAEAFIIKPKDPREFWEELLGILEECKHKKEKILTAKLIEGEEEFLKKYSHIVAVKLEEKVRELEKAKAKILESEQCYRNLFSSLRDVIISTDAELKIVNANQPALRNVFGYELEDIVGQSTRILYADDVGSNVMGRKISEKGEFNVPVISEVKLRTKSGNVFIAELSAQKLKNDKGDFVGYIGMIRDITERKKSEELIRGILESVDEGFIIIDRDYRIISANKAFAEEAKMPVEDIVGKYCYEVSYHSVKLCYGAGKECAVRHVFETGEHRSVVHMNYDAKGNPVYIETKAYSLSRDESGKVMTAIEILIDITEEKHLEEQLRQVQKMEAIGQLAGSVAHDFKNILTTIIDYGHVALMKMAEDDPMRLNIERMLEGADRAALLTQSLLAFGRKQVIERKPVDINEIIKKVEKLLLRIIGEDVEFKTIIDEGTVSVLADPGQIEQVLMNLATNARDAMPNGGTFTIAAGKTRLDEAFIKAHGFGQPRAYAIITVSDTGTGMNEKTRQKIFEPFFTTKEVGKGTGLGLAAVYGIIKQHDGYINVYSEPDKGTTFRIYLPVIASGVAKEERTAESEFLKSGTETILLAEDDESIRNLAKSVLAEFGYNVIDAIDGEDAVKKFMENKEKIRLLLFDLIMPKKSGKEAYDKIKQIRPDIKTIVMSGYSPDLVQQKVFLEKEVTVVLKPVSPTVLLRKVREALDR